MRNRQAVWTAALLALWAGRAFGQTTGVPVDTGAAAVPTTAAVPEKSIFSFLGLSHANLAKCRDKFCASGLGTLARSMTSPVRGLTGGLLPECCPQVLSAADLAKLAAAGMLSPAEAAAAQIKADEASSKARRLAVRYLGTVDCHYYPEAEAGILAALRADRIECVRIEAALALANGCCCTRKTVAALNLVVSGGDKDGNPAETSERVKCIAFDALQRCMSVPDLGPAPPMQPPELPAPAAAVPLATTQASFRTAPLAPSRMDWQSAPPIDSVVEQARRAFAERVGSPHPQQTLSTGKRTLFHVVAHARQPRPDADEPTPRNTALPPAPLTPIGLTPIGLVPVQASLPTPMQQAPELGFMPR